MKGGEDIWRESAFGELPTLCRDLELAADHCLRGGRAEADDDVRLDRGDFALEPLVAGVDLALGRRLVKAPLAARLPLEVLYGVRYVDVVALHSGGLERAVEKPSGRTDKRQALLVLLVARLLADQHDPPVGRAGPEHSLGGVRPQRADP